MNYYTSFSNYSYGIYSGTLFIQAPKIQNTALVSIKVYKTGHLVEYDFGFVAN